jgi:hypothetical protein
LQKKKSVIRSDIVFPLLAIFAVLLAGIAFSQPWWSMNTSPEWQMMSSSTMTVNVGLYRTVSVVRTDPNGTASATSTFTFDATNTSAYKDPIFNMITVSRQDGNKTTAFTFGVSNMTIAQVAKGIADQANLTLALAATGMVLAIATALLILMITIRGMALEKYTYLAGVLATIMLLVAPLLLSMNVAGFSGSWTLAYRGSVWNGETLATWGPSTGWFLAAVAALITMVCLLPVRTMYSDRKRGIQSLK